MCTVSFVPLGDKMIFTSNRDEHISRLPALAPKTYRRGDLKIIYPKDADKGGTWFAVNGIGNIGILLNGADTDHRNGRTYAGSRGQIVLSVIGSPDPMKALHQKSLEDTEPFTLIIFCCKRLYQFRWNGMYRSFVELDTSVQHIWSSATLYNEEKTERRKRFFDAQHFTSPEQILQFHKRCEDADPEKILLRGKEYNSVSITTAIVEKRQIRLRYEDLLSSAITMLSMPISTDSVTKRWRIKLRTLYIKIFHWEYWPFQVLYFPVYFYYAWLSLRAGSFFFFNASNPSIENGGFLMESKKDIYDLLPENSYPTTLFCKAHISIQQAENEMNACACAYPMIAKPNIGLRGMGVKLLHDTNDLKHYIDQCDVDFLLQTYVDYENEAGIFYCRYPDAKKGFISGMVLKEFLTVQGDGKHSVQELMMKDDRAFLQIAKLEEQGTVDLYRVLNPGEQLRLPYGNHSRGAKFTDGTDMITECLQTEIDDLCSQVKDFHFGRLDIRYRSADDLRKGINFSVIELNGAGSEPAHIYDPKHRVFFAWKEIIRHLNILCHISLQNKRSGTGAFLSFKQGMDLLRTNRSYLKRLQNPAYA